MFVESMCLANVMVSIMSLMWMVDDICWKRDSDVCSTLNNCFLVIHADAISNLCLVLICLVGEGLFEVLLVCVPRGLPRLKFHFRRVFLVRRRQMKARIFSECLLIDGHEMTHTTGEKPHTYLLDVSQKGQ